jgi:hypothetical protein
MNFDKFEYDRDYSDENDYEDDEEDSFYFDPEIWTFEDEEEESDEDDDDNAGGVLVPA